MQEGVLISRFDGSGSGVEQKLGSRIVKRKRSESSKLRIWVENLPTFLGSHHCMYQFFFISILRSCFFQAIRLFSDVQYKVAH